MPGRADCGAAAMHVKAAWHTPAAKCPLISCAGHSVRQTGTICRASGSARPAAAATARQLSVPAGKVSLLTFHGMTGQRLQLAWWA